MLTENTENAILCIELIDEVRLNEYENTLKDLAKTVQDNLGRTGEISNIDIKNKEVLIK